MPETFTTKRLAAGAGLPTSLTTYYTVPAATKAVYTSVTFCNTSASLAVSVTLAVGIFVVIQTRPLLPLETLVLQLNIAAPAGEILQASADTTALVHMIVSGVEIT
jgi:hypothetical protein